MWAILFKLICGHYLADFPLQGEWLAVNKAPGKTDWVHAMAAHCAIQALFVYLATGSVLFGVVEFVLHFAIDSGKCVGKLTFTQDQAAHLLCKIGYWVLIVMGVVG